MQISYKESIQRNTLLRPVSTEAEIPRARVLAGAKVSEKGDHYSSRNRGRHSPSERAEGNNNEHLLSPELCANASCILSDLSHGAS